MSKPAARCLVIGGSGAVGSATCRALAREGACLAFTFCANEAAAVSLARECPGSTPHRCDVRDFKSVRSIVAQAVAGMGGLDAVVYAAGISGREELYRCVAPSNYGKLQALQPEDLDEAVAVNARGVLAVFQAAELPLRESGGGNLVAVGSIDGVKPVPSPTHFATSVAALKGLVDSLSKELGNHNIRVNMVAPGILEGGSSRVLGHEVREAYLKHCSLKRFGRMEEAAELLAWLALENTYITGQALLLEGGL